MISSVPAHHTLMLQSVAKQVNVQVSLLSSLYNLAQNALAGNAVAFSKPIITKYDDEAKHVATVVLVETGLFVTLNKDGLMSAGQVFVAEVKDAVRGNTATRCWAKM